MAEVRTTDGTLLRAWDSPPSTGVPGVPLTPEQAASIAQTANDRAEAMGLTVRYEVKE